MPEVQIEESRRFIEECLVQVGTPVSEARAHADLLIKADLTGHFSHGLNRLDFYLYDVSSGVCNAKATPVILKEAPATAWVDGRDALGATVGNFCMDLAIRKAKDVGIGWVSVKGSTHFGMAGYWAQKAQREGLIGMAFTNSSPVMVPTRAKEKALGTNPISLAMAGAKDDAILVDMAMTTVAVGKIEMQVRKGEPIPEGWALDPEGNVTTDANLALETSKLLPLGGAESTSGYKGYGLSAMVEIFCSVLGGSIPTYRNRKWGVKGVTQPMDLGQCYVAINPDFFSPGHKEALSDCLDHVRGLEPVDPALPVLAPGDKERLHEEETRKRGTIKYTAQQIETCKDIAKRLAVDPIKTL